MKRSQIFALIVLSLVCFGLGHPILAKEASSTFAYKIVCNYVQKQPYEKPFTLYTRLEAFKSLSDLPIEPDQIDLFQHSQVKIQRDENIIKKSGGYYGASANQKEFVYNIWSCDSWDYDYHFNTSDLMKDVGSSAKTMMVRGTEHAEVRGDDEGSRDVECKAFFK